MVKAKSKGVKSGKLLLKKDAHVKASKGDV